MAQPLSFILSAELGEAMGSAGAVPWALKEREKGPASHPATRLHNAAARLLKYSANISFHDRHLFDAFIEFNNV